jgi:outer membrane protein TolC
MGYNANSLTTNTWVGLFTRLSFPADTAFDLFGNGLPKKHATACSRAKADGRSLTGRYTINDGFEGSPPINPTRIGIGMTEDKRYGAVALQKHRMVLISGNRHLIFLLILMVSGLAGLTGCQTPRQYRENMDKTADAIISASQMDALGQVEPFSVERPGDLLRRRLLMEQDLPYTTDISLGSDQLKPIKHWPEKDGWPGVRSCDDDTAVNAEKPLILSLQEALEIGARNNFDYQTQKEEVFRSALALDLEQNEFRTLFFGQLSSLLQSDLRNRPKVEGQLHTGEFAVSRKLKNGVDFNSAFAVDLAKLLTGERPSSLGIAADASISIPLLRGAGEYIVTEPLTQAERNVVYAIWNFERFKQEFAVEIASSYLSVLRLMDAMRNSEEDYRSRIISSRRSRRLADAGRLQEIEVDQAVQNELQSRQRWISAIQQYQEQLDSFKLLLGLPPDANLEPDTDELKKLTAPGRELVTQLMKEEISPRTETPPADAPVELLPPDYKNAGPLEWDERRAIETALKTRLDMRSTLGSVYDAQRGVVVAADALGAELTFFGSAEIGERRTITSADLDDVKLRVDRGVYAALLTLDLPLERTSEAVAYRNSFIWLEQAVRAVQSLEDRIKIAIRSELRNMLSSRENLHIQAKAVMVAEKRVRSVTMFLDAGRAQIRDLLEAQDSLLSAQNSLTSAVVNYRLAELRIQRDMGVLRIDADGMWHEYSPEEEQNDADDAEE